ncbi:shikimate dehydrogenase [Streptomyces sp. NPDC058067]|uniref:shikimate dehydrogenase n=1 Tax=Streptomyces sp. NPDC058067 TaxID=3346324 RepID=UPI0036E535F1
MTMNDRAAPLRVALLGHGISSSLSPRLHESEASAQGLTLRYELMDTRDDGRPLSRRLDELREHGYAGANITHPHKREVIDILDEVAPAAQRLGAVNTVLFTDRGAVGHNTDAPGYAAAFRRHLAGVPMRSVVQTGAGGAGSAVAHAQLDAGVGRIGVYDVDHGRAKALVADLREVHGAGRAHVVTDVHASVAEADGLVNASPVGMAHLPGTPVSVELLRPPLWVSDVVYMPVDTELLVASRARGLRTLSGIHMCVHQAALAFELFTGHTANVDRMAAQVSEAAPRPTDSNRL